jgi:hypothetical protein
MERTAQLDGIDTGIASEIYGLDAQVLVVWRRFVLLGAGRFYDIEDHVGSTGLLSGFDADIAEAAGAPQLVDVFIYRVGVEWLAHLCRQIHLQQGAA